MKLQDDIVVIVLSQTLKTQYNTSVLAYKYAKYYKEYSYPPLTEAIV